MQHIAAKLDHQIRAMAQGWELFKGRPKWEIFYCDRKYEERTPMKLTGVRQKEMEGATTDFVLHSLISL